MGADEEHIYINTINLLTLLILPGVNTVNLVNTINTINCCGGEDDRVSFNYSCYCKKSMHHLRIVFSF